jgi:hypothetical protein
MSPLRIPVRPVQCSAARIPDEFADHPQSIPHRQAVESGREVDIVGNQQRFAAIYANYEPLMPRSVTIVGQNAGNRPSRVDPGTIASRLVLLRRSVATIQRRLRGRKIALEVRSGKRHQQRQTCANPRAPQAM